MNWLKKTAWSIYSYWSFGVFFLLMAFVLPFVILIYWTLEERRAGKLAFYFIRFWQQTFCICTGVRYKFVGKEHLDPKRAYIFVPNHASHLDSPALVAGIPEQFKALGKQEILKYPLFGQIFKYLGVTVDRTSVASRRESFKVIRNKIDKGIHIVIFAEGTMNRTEQLLQPFFDGAFRIAVETKTPIVPMTICNARHMLPPNTLQLRPGDVVSIFGEPIETQHLGLEDVARLKKEVFEQIKSNLETFEAQRDPSFITKTNQTQPLSHV
ncbi:MAG: 1-acyl-sn-glycerol-3-phosphate acyltransferase [Cytophagales bacterium]|nr:MAG: 1-acyl-sn-glycerol-3-phosphate acyltransferase [Cytophagales bacterium]TAF61686.1 MAG: 1-acyl-sn-glycerol-3-phosphate acyltransferase [Cytophagales bacterium]